MNVKTIYLIFIALVLFTLLVFPQKKVIFASQTGDGPDIIIWNGNILTMDEQHPIAQAVAITGNRIDAVGSSEEILSLRGDNTTTVVDLNGRTVVPGLIEAHGHLLQRAFVESGIEGLREAAEGMVRNGYTTVHEMNRAGFIEHVVDLAESGDLPIRVNFYQNFMDACGTEIEGRWNSLPYTERVDTLVRIIGVKMFGDGGACNRGCNTTPYQEHWTDYGYGTCYLSQAVWDSLVTMVLSAGYPVAMHAIGDSAIGIALNAFEKAFGKNGNTLRSRMEHLRVMRDDLIEKMAELGIAASIQYTWAGSYNLHWELVYEPHVLEWIYPWRRMADKGIPIVGGNDPPFVIDMKFAHSMQSISVLATRKLGPDHVVPDWLANDMLTVEEGLRAMTVTNAWVVFEEDEKGTITPGKLADLTVLSGIPLEVDPFDVRYIEVEMVIVDGKIRYASSATSVAELEHELIPERFYLLQNYPNPFNPTTVIGFRLPPAPSGGYSLVTLKIYNVLGEEVATLVNEELTSGTYEVTWDAEGISSGIYYYRIKAGEFRETKKLILLK